MSAAASSEGVEMARLNSELVTVRGPLLPSNKFRPTLLHPPAPAASSNSLTRELFADETGHLMSLGLARPQAAAAGEERLQELVERLKDRRVVRRLAGSVRSAAPGLTEVLLDRRDAAIGKPDFKTSHSERTSHAFRMGSHGFQLLCCTSIIRTAGIVAPCPTTRLDLHRLGLTIPSNLCSQPRGSGG